MFALEHVQSRGSGNRSHPGLLLPDRSWDASQVNSTIFQNERLTSAANLAPAWTNGGYARKHLELSPKGAMPRFRSHPQEWLFRSFENVHHV